MPVTQNSNVGITSNPDARPANGSTTLVTTSNWGTDPNRNHVTVSIGGRKASIYQRNVDPRKP